MATLKQQFVFLMFLTSIAACSGSGEGDPANQSPSADAGPAQTVDERSIVGLTGSASDADGTISSYAWSQQSGTSTTLENADTANASFRAPNIPADETLVFRLQVTDDKGATAAASVEISVLDNAEMLITAVDPSFGLPGDRIAIELEGADPQTIVQLNGVDVVPETIELDSTVVTFVIPDGVSAGPIRTESGAKTSNTMWFDIGEEGVLAPREGKIVTDALGNEVSIDSFAVSLLDSDDNRVEADRLAGIVSGEVVGRLSMIDGWQIRVDVDSLDNLKAIASSLQSEPSVDFVLYDVALPRAATIWPNDPDVPDQRARNRVEEGAILYASRVDATAPAADGKVRPFFMSIGVWESSVDFDLEDFSGYKSSPSGLSGNVAIYSAHRSTDVLGLVAHGSNVTGVIAAELEDGGNAGLIRALSDSHGGANISVNSHVWQGLLRGLTNTQLEAGARVLNWSFGYHHKDFTGQSLLSCDGSPVTHNPIDPASYSLVKLSYTKYFETLRRDWPDVVVVAAAGNGAALVTPDNVIPPGIESEQMIVVGAHTTGGNWIDASGNLVVEDTFASGSCYDENNDDDALPKRAHYSDFGQRVDIAAAGSIAGFSGSTPDISSNSTGTSFAAPLVTATVALMQSINPNLGPAEIKSLLRTSSLPIQNEVVLYDANGIRIDSTVFTAPLLDAEKPNDASAVGLGAQLNVEGAIDAALASLGDETLQIDDPYTITIGAGIEEITRTISAIIPAEGAVFDKVDIMFLVDVSGSYGDDIATFRDKANELIDAFASAGNDVQIGITSFSDFPQSPYGASTDYEYRLDQPLTSDFDAIRAGLDAVSILNGADNPESQLEALLQTAQPNVGWRSGALPVIFLATDASFHNSDNEPAYPGAGYDETLTSLTEKSITVFGLQSGGTIADVAQITTDTGGVAFVLSRDSAEIVAAVQSAIGAANSDLVISLEPFGDFANLVKSITPTDVVGAAAGDPITGVNPGDTVNFDVVFDRGNIEGTQTHTFSFRLRVVANDVALVLEIPLTVLLSPWT